MINPKTRSPKQNNSLHAALRMVAEELNDSGQTMTKFLKPGTEIPWTEESAKEFIFKPIAKVMTGKDSTTELTTKELQDVWTVLASEIAKRGIYIAFPSSEESMLRNLTDE